MKRLLTFEFSRVRISLALLSFVLVACQPRPVSLDTDQQVAPIVQQSQSPSPIGQVEQNGQIGNNNGGNTVGAKAPTFYQDVLTVLKKNTLGQNYKCLVCHALYSDPKIVSVPRTADDIINSIEAGRMPLNGDAVSASDLEVLKTWRRSGMQIGTPP